MDDRDGRTAAVRLGLAVLGTLGVIERAAERDLVDISAVARRLAQTDFRLAPRLVQDAVDRVNKRRAGRSAPPPAG